jgi:RNA polymerase sigma factor (sigma-70 family)
MQKISEARSPGMNKLENGMAQQQTTTTFDDVFDRYFEAVYKYMLFRVCDEQLADDLTAQTFERALRSFHQYQPGRGAVNTWLFGIARHVVSDHFRRGKSRHWLPFEFLQNKPVPMPSPEEIVLANHDRAALQVAISQLGDLEREILALKFSAGFTNRQIARHMHRSESNIGVILYRTMKRLRALLQGGSDYE